MLLQYKQQEVFRNINRNHLGILIEAKFLRGKAGNHFQLLVIELLSGSRGLVVLSPAWKTTRSEFDSQ